MLDTSKSLQLMIFRMKKIFEIKDEVTEDSVEQIEAKQFPCDGCEYDAQ